MAYARYNQMIQDIRPLQQQIETTFNEQQPKLEADVLKIFYDQPEKALLHSIHTSSGCRLVRQCGGVSWESI